MLAYLFCVCVCVCVFFMCAQAIIVIIIIMIIVVHVISKDRIIIRFLRSTKTRRYLLSLLFLLSLSLFFILFVVLRRFCSCWRYCLLKFFLVMRCFFLCVSLLLSFFIDRLRFQASINRSLSLSLSSHRKIIKLLKQYLTKQEQEQ